MLMIILKRLASGGLYTNKSMAKELGVDESLVEQMVSQLNRMGYIEKEDMTSCSSGCSSCSSKSSCCDGSSNININMWKITAKGREAILNLGK